MGERSRTGILLLVLLFLSLFLFLLTTFEGDGIPLLSNNFAFFLLMNVNIIVVMVLAFLVVKNIVKLVLDRRRQILGSALRTRLVVAFVGLTLIPAALLFFVSQGIVASVLDVWFSPQVNASVEGALALARYQYDALEEDLRREASVVSRVANTIGPLSKTDGVEPSPLESYLKNKQGEYGLRQIALVDENGTELVSSSPSVHPVHLVSVQTALAGTVVVRPEQSLTESFLRAYSPVSQPGAVPRRVAVLTLGISADLGTLLSRVLDAFDDYKELRTYRIPLASSYLLTLAIVTLMVLFGAVWVGFYLARMLSVPIQLLAEGTQEIAKGNLSVRVPELGKDEIGVLVKSFNTMAGDLEQKTGELVRRRTYMETVLGSIAVGVIAIDDALKVTTMNSSAREILGLGGENDTAETGLELSRALPVEMEPHVALVLKELSDSGIHLTTATVSLTIRGVRKNIQITATRLPGELGTVLLLDDLTELVNAQRMAAWQEVARRIAHEIKNPLTPIQLSAQRLQRKSPDEALVHDCAAMIIKQVETLRNLVNEFSRFARMPASKLAPVRLNEVLAETVGMFREAHPEIDFRLALTPDLPVTDADREQMSRVFVNLLDNAVSAIQQQNQGTPGASDARFTGRITVESAVDRDLGLLSVTFADDGLGVTDGDKPKLFEPYFSTKKGGTGLGLAIVSSIVADHHGFIRVRDNKPRGALFVIELPVIRSPIR